MEQMIICVNENDEITGYGEKLEVHRQKRLHRAFSVFLYDPSANQYLMQMRARDKYHSGGLWSNACCSHPRKGEELHTALIRRLEDELGLILEDDTEFYPAGTFVYFADFGQLAEHELDHVFVLCLDHKTPLKPNPEEIEALRWTDRDDLISQLNQEPRQFSAWFAQAFSLADQIVRKEWIGKSE